MNRGDEAGVTLIELLVAIAMVGIIVPAIAAAFVVGFRTYADTGDRVITSSAADIVTIYWGPDVMNATSVDLGASPGCALPGGATPVVSFGATAGRVTWFFTGSALVRRECATTSDTTVSGAVGSVPAATCLPANCSKTVQLSLTHTGSTPVLATSLVGSRRNAGA